MTTEQLIIQAIDNCIEFANAEQKRLYCWMKATLQYPDIERFVEEVKVATQGEGKVSAETIHKAIEYASSENEWLIRSSGIFPQT